MWCGYVCESLFLDSDPFTENMIDNKLRGIISSAWFHSLLTQFLLKDGTILGGGKDLGEGVMFFVSP